MTAQEYSNNSMWPRWWSHLLVMSGLTWCHRDDALGCRGRRRGGRLVSVAGVAMESFSIPLLRVEVALSLGRHNQLFKENSYKTKIQLRIAQLHLSGLQSNLTSYCVGIKFKRIGESARLVTPRVRVKASETVDYCVGP